MIHIKWLQTMFMVALAIGQVVAGEKAFDYALPHIPGSAQADEPGFLVEAALLNPNPTAIAIELVWYENDGQGNYRHNQEAGGSLILHPNAVTDLLLDAPASSGSGQRWLGIRCDGQTLLGYYSFTFRDADGKLKYQAALPMTPPLPVNETITFSHIAQNRDFFVGMALTNLSEMPNHLSLRAYNAAGADRSHYLKAAEHLMVLAPHQKRIANFDNLFVDGAYQDDSMRDIAWVEVVASQPLTGLELFGSRDRDESGFVLNQLAGLPVSASSADDGARLLPLNLLDNDYSGFSVLNPSAQSLSNVPFTFYHVDGNLAAAANLDLPATSKMLGVHLNAGNLIFPFPENTLINEANVHPLGTLVVDAPVKLLSLFGTGEGYEGLIASTGAPKLGLVVPPQSNSRLVIYSETAGQLQINQYNEQGTLSTDLHTLTVSAHQLLNQAVFPGTRYIQLSNTGGGRLYAYLLETRSSGQEANRAVYTAQPIATATEAEFSAEVWADSVIYQGETVQAAILGEQLTVSLPPLQNTRYTLQVSDQAGNAVGEVVDLNPVNGMASFDTADARHGLANGQTYQLTLSAWSANNELLQQRTQQLTIDIAAFFPDDKLLEKLGNPTNMADLQRLGFLLRDEAYEVSSLRGIEKISDLRYLYLEVTAPNETVLDFSRLTQLEELNILLMNGNVGQLILPSAAPLRTVSIEGAPMVSIRFDGKPMGASPLVQLSLQYCANLQEIDLSGLPQTVNALAVSVDTCPNFASLKLAMADHRSGSLDLNFSGTAIDAPTLIPEDDRNGFRVEDSLTINNEPIRFHTVEVTKGEGGIANLNTSLRLPEGSKLTLIQTPWPSHTFAGWEGVPTDQAQLEPLQITVDQDTTITPTYREKSYRITTSIDAEQGSITPAMPSVAHNGSVMLTLEANAGYNNPVWSDIGDATVKDNTLFVRNVRENREVTANLDNSLSVSVNVQPAAGGQIKPAASQSVLSGGSVTFEAEANAPFVFASWQGVPAEQALDNPLTLTNITASMTLTAHFNHTIVVASVVGSGSTNPAAGTYPVADGGSFTITASGDTAKDYFTGWGTGVDEPQRSNADLALSNVRASTTLRPSFVRQHSVVVSARANGTTDRNGTHLVVDGQSFTVTATPTSDYVFSKWEGNPPAAQATNPTLSLAAVDRDYELEAVFANPTVTYTLTVNAAPTAGGTTNRDGVSTHVEGSGVFVEATAAQGWVFTGWSGDNRSTINPVEIVMNGNKVITANFANERTVSIAVQPAGSGTTNPAAGDHIVLYGSNFGVTATPAADYVFSHWSGAATGTAASTTLQNIQQDQQLIANFEQIMHQVDISVNPVGLGIASPSSGMYPQGQLLTITAIPIEGAFVGDWTLNGNVVQPRPSPIEIYTFTVTENHQVVVYFQSGLQKEGPRGNRAPEVVSEIPDQIGYAATPFRLDVRAHFRDPDGDKLTFSSDIPEIFGLGISEEGTFYGRPPYLIYLPFEMPVTVKAKDPSGLSVTDTFILTIYSPP